MTCRYPGMGMTDGRGIVGVKKGGSNVQHGGSVGVSEAEWVDDDKGVQGGIDAEEECKVRKVGWSLDSRTRSDSHRCGAHATPRSGIKWGRMTWRYK
jgi:hypothetical protein